MVKIAFKKSSSQRFSVVFTHKDTERDITRFLDFVQLCTQDIIEHFPHKIAFNQTWNSTLSQHRLLTWASSRYPLQVIRVVGDAIDVVVRFIPHAELACVGDTQRDGTRSLQQGHRWSVDCGHDPSPGDQACSEGHACRKETCHMCRVDLQWLTKTKD